MADAVSQAYRRIKALSKRRGTRIEDFDAVIDASALQLLLLAVIGWLDRREREAMAYLIERIAFFDDRSVGSACG